MHHGTETALLTVTNDSYVLFVESDASNFSVSDTELYQFFFGNASCSTAHVTYGAPQGSVLGYYYHIFVIYMRNVDDTQLFT